MQTHVHHAHNDRASSCCRVRICAWEREGRGQNAVPLVGRSTKQLLALMQFVPPLWRALRKQTPT